ncbi:MAG: flagellar biosynthesis protein FlaG [endosymbiont of Galathealinum brachiosum]|uniref:Flagellar biosynthesis protein FlaG n=1 Tax=endosymbiont of Galathealinum brachiosum TaxID=2200906 RepID=A0A370DII9_9GAMM|nr:MAG: flagellar biosynthesis protein FlaG [endosymbiont of Galathealinum brachiosum]
MSSDIMTSQISKDLLSSSSVVKSNSTNVNQVENRQNLVAESAASEGKVLPPEAKEQEVSSEDLKQAVTELNQHIQNIERDLFFSVDDSSGRTVVKVVNSETEEVIRQIPSEEVLRISRSIHEQMGDVSGLIFETSA